MPLRDAPPTSFPGRKPTKGEVPVRVCVIDLGTNSFHAVVVDVHPKGTFKRVDRLKEMVHLGEGTSLEGGHLTEAAMDRAFAALQRIQQLARGWEAREFVACATSALREAKNGGAFIERVRQELGMIVRPISGQREAELIYRGVRHAVDLRAPSLIVDVGGGSVEFIVGSDEEALFAQSLKLGAARLTARFAKSDPLSEEDAEAMRAHCRAQLGDVLEACREHDVRRLVGSSGTLESLAAVCAHRAGSTGESIFQQAFSVEDFRNAAWAVIGASEKERADSNQIEDRRVAQIPAGAVLADLLLDALPDIKDVRISPYALREGMVVDFIEQSQARIRELAPLGGLRRRSGVELAMRFGWEEAHARHVARSAVQLFDAVRPLLPDGGGAAKEGEGDEAAVEGKSAEGSDRELLEYAALLHDVGYHISHRRHEQHSHYLIEHSDLHGFSGREARLLALIARYHRGAFPKRDDAALASVSDDDCERIRRLAALLRLAESLDRSHLQGVESFQAKLSDEALEIIPQRGDGDDDSGALRLEHWALAQSSGLFEEVFGRTVTMQEP